jgi:hypothetical protein
MSRIRVGWIVIFLLAAGTGCADKNSVPSGILAREDMQNVLWDMIQADQYSTYLAKDSTHTDLKLENMRLYEQVFLLHHITREKFSKSYKYYLAHPELTQTLLDSLQAMGNRLRAENYNRPVYKPASPPPPPASPAGAPGANKQPVPAGVPTTKKIPVGTSPVKKLPQP